MNEAFALVAMPKTMDNLRITEFASQQAVPRRYLASVTKDTVKLNITARKLLYADIRGQIFDTSDQISGNKTTGKRISGARLQRKKATVA